MTIKEIRLEREALERLAKDAREAESKRLETLNKEEAKAKKDLEKKIKSHFKGVIPTIVVKEDILKVYIDKIELLRHAYGSFVFEKITKRLAHTILAEYEAVFGEMEEQTNTCVSYEDGILTWTPHSDYGASGTLSISR